jgi:multiple sugar transport system permease protein
MSVIGSFRVFSEVFALFGGEPGPGNSALTVVFYVWQSFNVGRFGLSSAAAVVLFAIILSITMIQMYIGKKLVHY